MISREWEKAYQVQSERLAEYIKTLEDNPEMQVGQVSLRTTEKSLGAWLRSFLPWHRA